jgi:fumarylacetoacetase
MGSFMTGPELDRTHDPKVTTWVASARDHPDFPIQNLPLGVVRRPGADLGSGAIRIGDEVLELAGLAGSGLLIGAAQQAAEAGSGPTLNRLFALGAGPRRALRQALHELLADGAAEADEVAALLQPESAVEVLLPAEIGDYTDFYAGIHHAVHVGALFRPNNPLLPNYRWVPIGYHGRSSTVQVSGVPFRRPKGQRLPAPDAPPVYEPTRRLDLELELGIWIGPGNAQGEPVPIGQAAQHVAGFCLLNDWSARDVQAWEYQPLGPFLAKNFATTVSAWVVTPEALAPYRTAQHRPAEDPDPLPYLADEGDRATGGLNVDLEVRLLTGQMRAAGRPAYQLSRSSTRHLYWTVAQLITHHTSGGCRLRPGDLLGSGTISAPTADGFGSLLEITGGGTRVIELPEGEQRTFLADGDEIILTARAQRPGAAPVGFGECRAVVLPADAA